MRGKKARVFWTGRSQAVSLPKEFRFNTDTVLVRRHGKAVRARRFLGHGYARCDETVPAEAGRCVHVFGFLVIGPQAAFSPGLSRPFRSNFAGAYSAIVEV